MAIQPGDNIEAIHYTNALSRTVAVLGNGSGQSGYGQVLATPSTYFSVSANDELIAADHWNKLRDDIGTCKTHQGGFYVVPDKATYHVIGANESYQNVYYYSSVATIQVLYPGSNVTSIQMTIDPSDGSIRDPSAGYITATAVPQLNQTNEVSSVTVTNVGSGYGTTPEFTITGTWDVAPEFRIVLGVPNVTSKDTPYASNGIQDIYSYLTSAELNESDIGAGQFTLTSDRSFVSSTRFSQWGGDGDPDDTIYCELDVVFDGGYNVTNNSGATVQASGEDHRRHFFNTGGEVRLSFTSTDLNDKDANWNTMFNNVGTVIFGKNSTTVTGSGLARDGATDIDGNGSIDSAIGNYQLTTGYQTIFVKYGTGVYSTNNVTVQAKRVGTNTIRFIIYFNDVAEGNPNLDERVLVDGGSQAAGIDLKRATGVCAIPEPSSAVTTELQNT